MEFFVAVKDYCTDKVLLAAGAAGLKLSTKFDVTSDEMATVTSVEKANFAFRTENGSVLTSVDDIFSVIFKNNEDFVSSEDDELLGIIREAIGQTKIFVSQ